MPGRLPRVLEMLFFGIVTVLAGLLALVWPGRTIVVIAVLALILGIFWIVNDAVEVFTALPHRAMPGPGPTILMGTGWR